MHSGRGVKRLMYSECDFIGCLLVWGTMAVGTLGGMQGVAEDKVLLKQDFSNLFFYWKGVWFF